MKAHRLIKTLLVGLCAWLMTGSALALTTFIQPASRAIGVGQFFSLNVFMTASQNEPILGWDFDVIYDTPRMEFLGARINADLWDAVPSIDAEKGVAGLAFDLPIVAEQEPVLLAEIDFRCLAAGTSTVNIGIVDDNDGQQGFQVFASPEESPLLKEWTAIGATITQQGGGQIPEPGTIALLAGGLLGWRLTRRARPEAA